MYKNVEKAPECIPVSMFYGLSSVMRSIAPLEAEQEHESVVPALQHTS